MKETFPVEWRPLFRSLTTFMIWVINLPLLLLMGIRWVSFGFDHAKAFQHLTLGTFALITLIGVPLISALSAFLVAQWLRMARVTVEDEKITGRNFWGWKNTLPLTDVIKLFPFSSNGISAIVVKSRYHGEVYISDYTERLPELLARVQSYLPEEQPPTDA